MSQAPLGYNSSLAPKSSGLAIASMVLGIISLVIFCSPFISFPCAVLAMVLGAISRSKISRGEASGAAMAMAGIVCGLIALILTSVLYIGLLSFLHFGAPALQKALDQQSQQIQKQLQQQQQHPATSPSGLLHLQLNAVLHSLARLWS
jgi:hypothetical protein